MHAQNSKAETPFSAIRDWLVKEYGSYALLHVLKLNESTFAAQKDQAPAAEELRQFHRAVSLASHKAKHLFFSLYNLTAGEKPKKAGLLSEIPHFFDKNVSYSDIFNDITATDNEPDLFSPLAYFTDLLRIIETHITYPFDIPEGHTLRDRRSDLFSMPLSSENADTLLPYTDIIQERLTDLLQKLEPKIFGAGEDAMKKYCAEQVYPAKLPFSLPYHTVSAALTKDIFQLAAHFNFADSTSLMLGTSEDYLKKLIACDKSFYPQLSGLSDYTKIDARAVAHTLGLTVEKLDYLFNRGIQSEKEYNAAAPGFYINKEHCLKLSVDEKDGHLTVRGLTEQGIAGLVRFVRFAAITGLTYEQLDATIVNGDIIAAVSSFAGLKSLPVQTQLLLPLISSLYDYGESNTFKTVFGDNFLPQPMKLAGILPGLAKIFAVSEREMETLYTFLYGTKDVSREELNAIYRNMYMAAQIGVNINEYLVYTKILHIKNTQLCAPFTNEMIANMLSYNELCGLNAYEADYILYGVESPFCGADFGKEDIERFIRGIWEHTSGFTLDKKNMAVRQGLIGLVGMNPTSSEALFNVMPTLWEEAFYTPNDTAHTIANYLARANILINKIPCDIFTLFSQEFFGEEYKDIEYSKLVTLCRCARFYSLNPVFFMLAAEAVSKQDKQKLSTLCALPEADIDVLISPLTFSLESISLFMKRLDTVKTIKVSPSNVMRYFTALTMPNNYEALCVLAQKLPPTPRSGNKYCAALTDVAIQTLSKKYPDIQTPEALSNYLLMDVKTDESVPISYVREGINAALHYINRCRFGLEMNVGRMRDITDEHWAWIMNYSEWKANRMVFVFPENYLLPDIRSAQSLIFKQSLQNISGRPLDAAASEAFYAQYLDNFAKLSDIVPCASYLSSDTASEQLYLFGRTQTDNKLFYCIRKNAVWGEWLEVEASVPVDDITPIFIFGKLFIFWIEPMQGTSPEISFTTENNETTPILVQNTGTRIAVKFTFRSLSGTWNAAKTLFNDEYIINDTEANYGKQFLNAYDTTGEGYKRLAAFRITERNFCDAEGKYYIKQSEGIEKLLIMLGGFVYSTPNEINEYYPLNNPHDTAEKSAFSNKHAALCDKLNILRKQDVSGHLCSGSVRVYGSTLREEHVVADGEFFIFDEYTGGAKPVAPAVSVDESASIVGSILNANVISNTLRLAPQIITKFAGRHRPEYAFTVTGTGNNKEYSGEFSSTLNTYVLGETPNVILNRFQKYLHGVGIVKFPEKGTVSVNQDNLENTTFYSPTSEPGVNALHFGEFYSLLLQCLGSQRLFGNVDNRLASDTEIIRTANLAGGFILKAGGMGGESFLFTPVTQEGNDGKPSNLQPIDSAIVISFPKITANDIGNIGEPKNKTAVFNCLRESTPPIIDDDGYAYMQNISIKNIQTAIERVYSSQTSAVIAKNIFGLLTNRNIASSFMFWSKNISKEKSITIYNALTGSKVNNHAILPVDTAVAMGMNPKENLRSTNVIGTNTPEEVSEFFNRYVNAPLPVSIRYRAEHEYTFDTKSIIYNVTRLTNPSLPFITPAFSVGGVADFLKLENQQAPVPAVLPIERFSPNPAALCLPHALDGAQPDFEGLYRNYNYELFYHIPLFAAKTLRSFGNYADAKKWLEYVYNPLSVEPFLTVDVFAFLDLTKVTSCIQVLEADKLIIPVNKTTWRVKYAFSYSDFSESGAEKKLAAKGLTSEDIYSVAAVLSNYSLNGSYGYCWQFFPFRTRKMQDLLNDLENDAQLSNYHANPYDPHAIASLRVGAYEKYTILEYVSLLTEWGDMEFAKLTWDSIASAYSLYSMASEVLGEKPLVLKQRKSDVLCFDDIYTKPKKSAVNELLENLTAWLLTEDNNDAYGTQYDNEFFIPYFKIPVNYAALSKWDIVADRLHKMRNNLDINGNARAIPLYPAAADPLQLAMTRAAGFLPSTKSSVTITENWYKYFMLHSYAKEFTGVLIQFSALLLSAIEKGDAEKLRMLMTGQNLELIATTKLMKENAKKAIEKEVDMLKKAEEAARNRVSYYGALINENISSIEKAAIGLNIAATAAYAYSTALAAGGGVAALVPDAGSPFAMVYGGSQLSGSLMNFSMAAMSAAASVGNTAGITAIYAEYARRLTEWSHQKEEADYNLEQIKLQIKSGELRLEAAIQDSAITEQIENQTIALMDYYNAKFTSENLYSTMCGLLRQTAFNAYQTAIELAARAEKAWQEETDDPSRFLTYTYWDDAKYGLLSGEVLMTALHTMQSAYLAKNPRRLEITKTISLSEACGEAFAALQTGNTCVFTLPLALFDQPGKPSNYLHKIRTLTVNTHVVMGAYQTIDAKLTQISSAMLVNPNDTKAVEYISKFGSEAGGAVPEGVVVNRRAGQTIRISNPQNESGMHFFDPSAGSYLPFEGTGAVSKWQLEFGKNTFDPKDISDIIITVAYTARESNK